MFIIATFYKFTRLSDCLSSKSLLLDALKRHSLKGTIILAEEGINGTIAGSREGIDNLKSLLLNGRFFGMEYKETLAKVCPFKYAKVRIKDEIVTMKYSISDASSTGEHVRAHEWNQLLNDPTVVVLDVRNDFEVKMGSFKNAINPTTKAFSDFPDFVRRNLSPIRHKKIAMSCTGGIRCEKASALMKSMGFLRVFQLKGGILQYLDDMPKDQSLWRGECFVFDERIALDFNRNPSR